jgi:hypothetical protein
MDVSVKILKWEKHNPRKDYKRPWWFALDNRMVEDDDFYSFSGGEFKAWIYILSKASQKNSPEILINFEAANRKTNLSANDIKSALEKLQSLGIVTFDLYTIRTESVQNPNGICTLQTIQTNKQTTSPDAVASFDFESVYERYPIKKGKKAAMKKLASSIKTQEQFDAFAKAVNNYLAEIAHNKTEPRFIKHFSTFVNNYEDYLNPDVIQPNVTSRNSMMGKF